MRIIVLCVTNRCKQFQVNIFMFYCAMTQNRLMVMMSFFETRFWEFLIVLRQNKRDFWNPEPKLIKTGFAFQNLTSFELNLAWP